MRRRILEKVNLGLKRLGGQRYLYGDPGVPRQAHICPTDRCNLSCAQCHIWKRPASRELQTEEWKRIIDELALLSGPLALNFAGGEPFLREDLLTLIDHAIRHGFTVSANTNGMTLTDDLARRLMDVGLDILYVSLDGARAETHNRLRRCQGGFERVLESLDRLSCYPRPRVVIASILHRESIPEIPALVDFVRSRGLQVVFQPLWQTFGDPYDPTWYERSEYLPTNLDELDRHLDFLISEKRSDGPVCNDVAQLLAFKRYFRAPTLPNGISCRAGFRDVAFDSTGNMRVCYQKEPIGNAVEKGVASLWWSAEAAKLRQEVVACKRTCNLQNCNFST